METKITGAVIRKLREEKHMTQAELAAALNVSDKAVSKWENGHGYPDISMLEPLTAVLGISAIEILSGEHIRNENRSSNMLRSIFYVCPDCGNVIYSAGKAVISCCGNVLLPLKEQKEDEEHRFIRERVEDEWYVTLDHPMTREHRIDFIAAVTDNGAEIVKLYPQGSCEARFKINRTRYLCACCNEHGFYKIKL